MGIGGAFLWKAGMWGKSNHEDSFTHGLPWPLEIPPAVLKTSGSLFVYGNVPGDFFS